MNNVVVNSFMDFKVFNLTMYQVLTYFIIFSIIGWVYELTFAFIKTKKIINKGFLNGSHCVMYGFNFCLIAFLLPGEFFNIFAFIITFIVTIFVEYISALMIEILYDLNCCEYQNSKYSYKGYVSLSSAFYKTMFFLIAFYIMKICELNSFKDLPNMFSHIFIFIYLLIVIFDFLLTYKRMRKLNEELQGMFRINRKFREFIETTGLLDTPEEVFDYAEMNFDDFYKQTSNLINSRGTKHPVYSNSEVLEKSNEMYEEYSDRRMGISTIVKNIVRNYPEISSLNYQKELCELIKFNNVS